MDDGATMKPANGHQAVDPTESPAQLSVTMTGYCAACGTWDSHGLSCSACGYDFAGAQIADPRD